MSVIERAKVQMQQMATFPVTPESLRSRVLNPKDALCPFHKYEGNEDGVRIALSLAKKAFNSGVILNRGASDEVVACKREYPVRLLLTGPRSVGKTSFIRHFAAIVSTDWDNTDEPVQPNNPLWKLPWVELDGTSIKKREEIFVAIEMACRAKGLPLLPVQVLGGVRHYLLPAMNLFIDEVHGLPKNLMEGILKMTEADDGILEVGVNIKVDCRKINILFGTTNPGDLKDTLLSRFLRIELEQHNLTQVAKIIYNKFKWPMNECLKLAELKPLPREALALAKLIEDTRQDDKITLRAAMTQWISNFNLQEGGLSAKAVEVLVSLAEAQPNGMSKENLCVSLSVAKEEFQKQLLPQLFRTPNHPAFVTVAGRHKITMDGLEELRRRGYTDY